MPKAKNNKAAYKRFRFTARGKVRRYRAFKSHILEKKTRKRKRRLRQAGIMVGPDARHVRRLIPHRP